MAQHLSPMIALRQLCHSSLRKEEGFHIQEWCGDNHMKSMYEGLPVGKPFCCTEVVTNSLEKVIISYLIRETSKQSKTGTTVKNNIEIDEK